MAGGWRLGRLASREAGAASGCRCTRLVTCCPRQRENAGEDRGSATGPNPTDRGKPGTKPHLVLDANGTLLGLILTGADCHNNSLLAATLDAVPGVRTGRRGRPRRRPDKLHADKGYDHRRCRRDCQARSLTPRIARRGIESRKRLGRYRWIVERTLTWPDRFRRLTICYDRHLDLHLAFTTLASAFICRTLTKRFVPNSEPCQ